MTWKTTLALCTTLGALAACGSPQAEEAPAIETASCESPIGGIEWTSNVTESIPGLEALLETIDLDALPAQIDTQSISAFQMAAVAYALEVPISAVTPQVDAAALRDGNELERGVLAAMADGTLDFLLFRRVLHRYYACSREQPVHLEDFRQTVFDYQEPSAVMLDSFPKKGPRTLYENEDRTVFVAETPGADGTVRETEILRLDTRTDGALDFLVYGEDGRLMDRSTFPSGTGQPQTAASPYTCIACHTDRDTNRVDVVFPDM